LEFDEIVKKEDLEKFAMVKEFFGVSASLEVPRDEVKNLLGKVLASDLPISDVKIDEEDIESIIRNIFTK
jgi:ABC-type uncharacterized transport system ATPase subunit